MEIDPPAVVAIKRSIRGFGVLQPLRVFIDGRRSGQIYRGTREFPVAPGRHVVSVTFLPCHGAAVCVDIRAGERIELCCTSDHEPLHPWHVHGMLFILVFIGLWTLGGLFFPPVRKFVEDHLLIEALLALAFGWVGMLIYFRRLAKTGTRRRPALYLTAEKR
jgi:hypothetical protein